MRCSMNIKLKFHGRYFRLLLSHSKVSFLYLFCFIYFHFRTTASRTCGRSVGKYQQSCTFLPTPPHINVTLTTPFRITFFFFFFFFFLSLSLSFFVSRLNHNKIDNVSTLHCGSFEELLLPWKRNSTLHFTVVGVEVVVNNMKVFSVNIERQHWVPYAVWQSYCS